MWVPDELVSIIYSALGCCSGERYMYIYTFHTYTNTHIYVCVCIDMYVCVLHLSSHTGLMQVLPGHPLADPRRQDHFAA